MPKRHAERCGSNQMPERMIKALDKATVILDIPTLFFWAGEGIGGTQRLAVARGALITQDPLGAKVHSKYG